MRTLKSAGECPKCGDDLQICISKSRNRFISCENPQCKFSYPVPKSGKIEASYEYCPDTQLPILIIVKKNHNVIYFWTSSPCFTCRKGSSCPPILELREEYEISTES